MYKDIISYQLAENVSEEHLSKIADEIVNNWMSNQQGFIKWEIHKDSDGSYTDIVYWESQGDAKKAEENMVNIPNAESWIACYKKDSIQSKHIKLIKTLK